MSFLPNNLYHLFNRSINKEILFKDEDDYLRFLAMTRKQLSENCNILGWCLMPNHFHFLIYIEDNSIKKKKVGLVTKMEEWTFSSFKDFIGMRDGTLGDIQLATELLALQQQSFYTDSYNAVSNETILKLGLDA
jgi:REP element-mobilizing transposase RayT